MMGEQQDVFIRPEERRFVGAVLRVTILLVLAFASFVFLFQFFSAKFHRSTGEAEWIWRGTERLSKGEPAAFYVAADFRVPQNAGYVKLNVVADPEYTLFFNGRMIGGAVFNESPAIDVYEVTPLAAKGALNRVVLAVRSEKGAGAILASVDFAPMLRNLVVSNAGWRVFERWDDRIVQPGWFAGSTTARALGKPPFGRWNWLEKREHKVNPESEQLITPLGMETFATTLPEIHTPSGVAVVVARPVEARVFDFGSVQGRGRITRPRGRGAGVVAIRFANDRSEFELEAPTKPVVFGPGETDVADPQIRGFRYIIVYDPECSATALVSKP